MPGLVTRSERVVTALPSEHCSGQHKTTGRGRPKNTWRWELENEMWTSGFRYSWRKMEEATQDRAGWRLVVCGLCSTESDKA